MENIFSFLFFCLLHVALARPREEPAKFKADGKFLMASIGDSWAAGAAVTGGQLYDDNWSCLRNKVAWEAQMAGDNTWTDSPIDHKFVACSGAQLAAAVNGDPENGHPEPQMASVGQPHLLTMELGGNNCHFSDIARACIFVGLDGKEYPDPNGECFGKLKQWGDYIASDEKQAGQGFYFDHHEAVKDIMNYKTVKGRDDFYLYIVGYAEFFSTSPGSDWCNDESFGQVRHPKLSNALRSKINELVRNVNSKIKQSVKDMNNDHIKFLDPTPLYDGHRFCEPGHTLSNQYFLNDVWFWNLSPPEDDPDYITGIFNPFAPIIEVVQQELWIKEQKYPNGTKATQDEIIAMVGGSNPYSSGRTFHPKDGGHTAMKDGLIAMLRKDKVPGVKQPKRTLPPKKQPYASGQMHIHIWEYWGCLDDENNLSVKIQMWDGAGNQIGMMERTQAGATGPAHMRSKLENELIITPEWAKGGYIQFQLGDLQFNTNDDRDENKPVFCRVGGWDPRQGPQCWIAAPPGPPIYYSKAVSIAQMDCWFPAPEWKGGNPSDGSAL
ncbi:hypothetical protein FQN53_000510 [Emmonsiellopsis sp. PD_33]|nr:hypothetical protein FQN53_000510 [Emmonsiellopsis sp. PD_33]